MTDIEKTAHILGKLVKDYMKVMYLGSGSYIQGYNARKYAELATLQRRQIKELQEGTPQCQI